MTEAYNSTTLVGWLIVRIMATQGTKSVFSKLT